MKDYILFITKVNFKWINYTNNYNDLVDEFNYVIYNKFKRK